MARTRKKTPSDPAPPNPEVIEQPAPAAPVEANAAPDVFDEAIAAQRAAEAQQITQQVADATRLPPAEPHPEHVPDAALAPAQPEHHQQPPALRTVVTYGVPEGKVHMIDDGNSGGLGVRFDLGDGVKPPAEALEPLKEKRGDRRGMGWMREKQQWRKGIRSDIAGEPTQTRLEVEARAKDAVTRLRERGEQGEERGR